MSATPDMNVTSTAALERSRARLRQALLGAHPPTADARSAGEVDTVKGLLPRESTSAASTASQRAARTLATADLALPGTWWKLGHDVADAMLAPTASRHPVALLLGSAAAGAVIAQVLTMRPLHVSHAAAAGPRRHVLRQAFALALAVTPPSAWRALAHWAVRMAAPANAPDTIPVPVASTRAVGRANVNV